MVRGTAVLLLTAVLMALGCTRPDPSTPGEPVRTVSELTGKLRCTGSSTCAPLVTDIARRFEAAHPGTTIEVATGGSSVGIRDAREGKADIGMSSRALNESEKDLRSVVLARDGICLIVHKDNPVKELNFSQVASIYRGKARDWGEVGGTAGPIHAFNRDKNRSEAELFAYFYGVKYEEIESPKLGDNVECLSAVTKDPNAVVYISVGEAELAAKNGAPIKLLPVDGVPATLENVRDGQFRLSRKLILVTKEAPAGLAKAFLDFATSAEARDLVRKHNFVPYP